MNERSQPTGWKMLQRHPGRAWMSSRSGFLAGVATVVFLLLHASPAFAIPSPDLAVNFFASAAQMIGLATMVVGGALFGNRGARRGLKGRNGRAGMPVWIFGGLVVLFLGSLAANIFQWAAAKDEQNRRLEANLVRPSVEAGESVGDVTLKTLSYSGQMSHPQGITTDELARLLDSAAETGSGGINFIDLREPEEREGGKLPTFDHVRYADFPSVRNELDLAGKTNVLLCYSGNRSSETCDQLAAEGTPCNFVIGGFEKWLAEGRQVAGSQAEAAGDLRALPAYPNEDILLDTPDVTALVRDEGAIFVDVRYPGDFRLGHLPDAINLPIRKMPTEGMNAAFNSLPDRPIVAACYDKRSCFYSKILGLRLTRLGLDFRGRYTAPHEYFEPKTAKAYVERWAEDRNKGLLAIASEPLEQLLRWIEGGSGSLPVAILLVVLLLRAIIAPFTIKAERDQIMQKRLAEEIAWLKKSLTEDKTRLSRALMGLYRKNGLTPGLNMIGICIQIPLFLAFFFAVDAVARTSGAALLWLPSLAMPDPFYILPVLIGGIVFLHLYGSAARHTPLFTTLRLAAGGLLIALTLPLGSAVNLYLVLSISMMVAQTHAVRMFVDRRQDNAAGQARGAGKAPKPKGDGRIFALSEAGYIATAGTKAGRLGLMLNAGLPVPDGMVIASDVLSQSSGDADLSPEDWRAIDALWLRLDAKVVAVRSSGLNEDGECHSYAGVFESILNVRRDALAAAIRAVRDSFRTVSAADYGEAGEERGGILIQKMVDPEFAGVMFTEHPGESGCLLIEMVSGLGAAIADGTATPDAYRVGRYSGRLVGEDAPPIDLAPLVALGRQLEALFDAPQDVEWAYRDGRFLILQSRNITALSRTQTANMKEFVQERERRRLLDLCADAAPDEPVFVLNELSELLPRPTPFSLSFMEALWQPGGSTDLACRALRIRYDVEENGSPFVTSVFGALYVNRREEKRRLKRGMGFLTNLRLTRMAEKLERDFRDDFLPEFHHEIRVYEAVDESRLKTDELFVLLDHVCRRFVTVNYVQAHIVNIAANFYVSLAERQLTKHGLSPAAYLGQMPATVVTQAMSLLPEIRSGTQHIDSFLDLFGHRAPTDYEFADPRYMEDPALVEQLIANASNSPAAAKQEQGLGALIGNQALGLCVERAGRFQGLKEEAKHHCLRELTVIRRILLELDRRLELDGGIFYVEYGEILRLGDPSFLEEAHSLIALRRAEAEIYEGMPTLPAELTQYSLESFDPSGAGTAMAGQLGSVRGDLVAGQAPIRGRARIVNTGDLAPLEDGEILITRFIHPSWAPAFPRLTGVVTEVGGWLSHAAILAREYNVPTIVGARGVLDAVVTGDDVQLNPDGSIERV